MEDQWHAIQWGTNVVQNYHSMLSNVLQLSKAPKGQDVKAINLYNATELNKIDIGLFCHS